MPGRGSIRLSGVEVRYGSVVALRDFGLEMASGEIVALLGPSGCGKSTALRAICGLQALSAGEIWFGDRLMNTVPPHHRKVGMVFQNYALFPHRTVAENIAFGLAVSGVPRRQHAARTGEVLALVQMTERGGHYPHQLSGGQQQRVAIARSVAVSPDILLLDEPLSALDKQLREQMRHELTQLLRGIGITTVFVTHDQEEAFALADRVVVMHDGAIVQCGTPAAIYARPNSRFVADFLGSISYLGGVLERAETGTGTVLLDDGTRLRGQLVEAAGIGTRVDVGLRWSSLRPAGAAGDGGGGEGSLAVTVRERVHRGDRVEYRLEGPGGRAIRLLALTATGAAHDVGDRIRVRADANDILLFRPATGPIREGEPA
ncbi:MAG: ABC transporter ATP-binding protein [Rhodobacteraceae bacterium]|nr:ABC transporter ATP-binding protein [Paracoccaceae bacterium]